jgi:small neutral amino acid transporter SnatA (MarC family)
MLRFLLSLIRRAICRLFGLTRHSLSIAAGIVFCTRCLRIVDYRTVRREVTRGEIEPRMAANPPEGYSFVNCN